MVDSKFDTQAQAQMAETTLELLGAVAEEEALSQRSLAERLGVALGLTNAVVKRCVKKGLLKIRQAPARRYIYYLTPQGFAEKSRLTAEYLTFSLQFYRQARQEYGDVLAYCATRGWRRVVLVGATELAEIASLAATGTEVKIIGILDPGRNQSSFGDIPVLQSLEDLGPDKRAQAVILTDTQDPQAAYTKLVGVLPEDRVLTPKLLHISTMAQRNRNGDDMK